MESVTRRAVVSAGSVAAAEAATIKRAVKNGRLRQSLVFWRLNGTDWKWDIDRISSTAKDLGCESVEYRAIYPTGESQVLLSVPRYDFNWQLTYDLARPITLPKGTELEVTAWYDNSSNNPFNPDPRKDVWWGQQTWEEMLAGFVDFVIPVTMNPRDVAHPAPQKVAEIE